MSFHARSSEPLVERILEHPHRPIAVLWKLHRISKVLPVPAGACEVAVQLSDRHPKALCGLLVVAVRRLQKHVTPHPPQRIGNLQRGRAEPVAYVESDYHIEMLAFGHELQVVSGEFFAEP